MARPRQRVRLEDGLKLDLNKLVRWGFWSRGDKALMVGTQWSSNWQGVIASALITFQKEAEDRGSLKIFVTGRLDQRLETPFDRAITAREKVKDRLIGSLDRRSWELPPKPKWMRWHTYQHLSERFRRQQGIIDQIMVDYVGCV